MLFDEKFRRPDGIQRLVKELWDISQETGPIRLMEICGTHTMAMSVLKAIETEEKQNDTNQTI